MNFMTFFSMQARKPTGLFGRFIAPLMFEKGNAELNALVKETISIKENDHALEIGFGPGTLIDELASSLNNGLIEGVDFSIPMVETAQKKNKRHIDDGKVKIRHGDFEKIQFEYNNFDKIFTVNTIYFWKNPKAVIEKIYHLLKPGGKVIIGFHEKSDMENMPLHKGVFKYYSVGDITELLSNNASFTTIDIVSGKGTGKTRYCAVGVK